MPSGLQKQDRDVQSVKLKALKLLCMMCEVIDTRSLDCVIVDTLVPANGDYDTVSNDPRSDTQLHALSRDRNCISFYLALQTLFLPVRHSQARFRTPLLTVIDNNYHKYLKYIE